MRLNIYLFLWILLSFSFLMEAQWFSIGDNFPRSDNIYGMDFINSDTGFAVTNQAILKTTNGGTEWVRKVIGGTLFYAINFINDSTGFIVGNSGEIYKSIDYGENWVQVPSGVNNALQSIFFINSQIGFITSAYDYFGGVILKTTDAGTNWAIIQDNVGVSLWSIFFTDLNTGYAVGNLGTILKTTDGGNLWESLNINTYNSLNSVEFINTDTRFVVGDDGIFKTTNGGNTWVLKNSGIIATSVFFSDALTGLVTGYGGKIRKTTNGGDNWTNLITGTNVILRDIWSNILGVSFVSGNGGTLLKTTDGGTNWIFQNSTEMMFLESVFFSSPTEGFAAGHTGTILKTNDEGENWIKLNSNTNNNLYSIFFVDDDYGYAAGEMGIILRTSNGGEIWIPQISGTNETINAILMIDSSKGFAVGNNGLILKTTNSGYNWSIIPSGTTSNLNSIFFTSENFGYIVGNYGIVLNSTDGGNLWQGSVISPNTNLYSIYFNDVFNGFTVGGAGKIFKTTNQGATWVSQNSGSWNTLYSVYFVNNDTGYTVGSGLRVTDDGGNNWRSQYFVADNGKSVFFISESVGYIVGTNTMLKTINGGGYLPVELSSFNYSVNINSVQLNWSTASETNNKGFEIQRRQKSDPPAGEAGVSSQRWKRIGFVEGKGTTIEPQSYSFTDENLRPGKYSYRLKQVDFDGTYKYSDVVEIEVAPSSFSLSQNYPNPFNPITNIEYRIPNREFVTLKVYDVLGKEVATLVNEEKPAGSYTVQFNGSNLPTGKAGLASGIYFYQIKAVPVLPGGRQAGAFTATKKLILMK